MRARSWTRKRSPRSIMRAILSKPAAEPAASRPGEDKAMEVTIRPTTDADVDDVGQILYDAFNTIADLHNFPRDFPTLEIARLAAKQRISHPRFYGIVAESAGAIVGSNFLDERGEARAIGPLS